LALDNGRRILSLVKGSDVGGQILDSWEVIPLADLASPFLGFWRWTFGCGFRFREVI
jgi:hypothetical protein